MTDITIANLARTIEAAEGETILSAALGAGIDFPHGCRSGRCGLCKSRLIDGEVSLFEHSRFALAPEEREAGLILACRAIPEGPVSLAWLGEEEDAAGHPLRSVEAVVEDVEELTHDIRRVILRPEGAPLAFAAGQYATLALPGLPPRDYSMANPPGAALLEFHVRKVPGGRTSPAIHTWLAPGDRLTLTGPRGAAHLRVGHTGPILAAAGGSGLAPILSILESAVALGMRQPVRVYVGARDERDLYGLDRLAALAARHGDMTVTPVLSAPTAPTTRRTGFVHAAIRADLGSLAGWAGYTAGPPAMVDSLAETLVAMGMGRGDLHADAFFTPEAALPEGLREAAG